MKVSVIAPVKNEFPWIGYSIMAAKPFVHEFVYAITPSDDGTEELVEHLSKGCPMKIIPIKGFDPLNQADYNDAFNICIDAATGDACFFLHPDMVITEWNDLQEGPLAWTTEITSYAGDFQTQIVGRGTQWKNIHAKKFGLHYFGGYGSQNEDFYHSAITGNAYKHYGSEFSRYPFEVATSGIKLNHYCELKSHFRRLEKMKLCLRTQFPDWTDEKINEMAAIHPRVTLEGSSKQFGNFSFEKESAAIPPVIQKFKAEFEAFKKELVNG